MSTLTATMTDQVCDRLGQSNTTRQFILPVGAYYLDPNITLRLQVSREVRKIGTILMDNMATCLKCKCLLCLFSELGRGRGHIPFKY